MPCGDKHMDQLHTLLICLQIVATFENYMISLTELKRSPMILNQQLRALHGQGKEVPPKQMKL